MPAKLDRCVDALLARKSFQPGKKPDDRKSAAYAICTSSIKRNHDLVATICQLPDDMDVQLDDKGHVRLIDNDVLMAENDQQTIECDDDPRYEIVFNEKEGEKAPAVFFAPCRVIALADKPEKDKDDETECAEPLTKIEMLREGNFKHQWYGDLQFNRAYFKQLIENFLNDVLDREIAFDATHDPVQGAVAWLQQLGMVRRKFKDGKRRYVLTGDVEPTTWGQELVKGKRFKYYSIEVNDKFADKETSEEYGPTIMGGGLTNRPFIPGMRPVMMSEDVASTTATEGEPAPGAGGQSPQPQEEGQQNDPELLQQLDELMAKDTVSLARDKQSRPPDSQLPNAAFALIKRDAAGKIAKRSLPHHGPNAKSGTENSSVDLGRLRNALARLNQTQGFSPAEIAAARRHLEAHARALLKSRQNTKAAEGVPTMEIQDKIDELQVKLDEMTDKNSEAAKAYEAQIKVLQETQTKIDASIKAQADEMTKVFDQKLAEQAQQLKTLAEQNAKTEAELSKTRMEKRQTEIKAFCDGLIADKHYPALVKVAREVMLADAPTNTSWKLSEDGKDTNLSLQDFVTRLFAAIPAESRVQTTTHLKQGGETKPDGAPKPANTISLMDGTNAEVLSDEALQKALKKTGFDGKGKNKNVQ